jgi:hypothetical protein
MKRIGIREILAVLIVVLCFAGIGWALVKHGEDKGTLNLILGALIAGIGTIGGYYFQSSHRPTGTVQSPTQTTDIHLESKTEETIPLP